VLWGLMKKIKERTWNFEENSPPTEVPKSAKEVTTQGNGEGWKGAGKAVGPKDKGGLRPNERGGLTRGGIRPRTP